MKTISEKFKKEFVYKDAWNEERLTTYNPEDIIDFILSEMTALMKDVQKQLQDNLRAEMELERCAGIMQSIDTLINFASKRGLKI